MGSEKDVEIKTEQRWETKKETQRERQQTADSLTWQLCEGTADYRYEESP